MNISGGGLRSDRSRDPTLPTNWRTLRSRMRTNPCARSTVRSAITYVARLPVSTRYAMRTAWASGMRQITSSTKPIRTANDLSGFRIRGGKQDHDRLLPDAWCKPGPLELQRTLHGPANEGGRRRRLTAGDDRHRALSRGSTLPEHHQSLWNGFWMLCNAELWKSLPADLQDVIERNMTKYGRLGAAIRSWRTSRLRTSSCARAWS